MKNTGKCPKCGCTEIVTFAIQGPSAYVTFGGRVPKQGGMRLDRYACGNCGFVEEWLDDTGVQSLHDHVRYREG